MPVRASINLCPANLPREMWTEIVIRPMTAQRGKKLENTQLQNSTSSAVVHNQVLSWDWADRFK